MQPKISHSIDKGTFADTYSDQDKNHQDHFEIADHYGMHSILKTPVHAAALWWKTDKKNSVDERKQTIRAYLSKQISSQPPHSSTRKKLHVTCTKHPKYIHARSALESNEAIMTTKDEWILILVKVVKFSCQIQSKQQACRRNEYEFSIGQKQED